MAKSKPQPGLEDLRRRLVLLDRLRGCSLRCAEGIALLDLDLAQDPAPEADPDAGPESRRGSSDASRSAGPGASPRIRAPRDLYEACSSGWPSAQLLAAAIELRTPPLILRPSLLATMQRDLRALSKQQRLQATLREAPRLFRRFGTIDEAWFTAKRKRLRGLADELRAVERGPSRGAGENRGGDRDDRRDHGDHRSGDEGAFLRVRALIAALRGEAAATAIDRACAALRDDSHNRRRLAKRRLAALLGELRRELAGGGRAPSAPGGLATRRGAGRAQAPLRLDAQELRRGPLASVRTAAAECLEAARIPGRRRRRRLEHILGRLLEVAPPEERTSQAGDHRPALLDTVAEVGERLIASIEASGGAPRSGEVRRFFGLYGLTFSPLPRPGSPPLPLTPTDLRRALRDYPEAAKLYGGLDLTIDEVLRLRRLDLGSHSTRAATMVAAGVPIAALEAIVAADALADFAKLSSPAAALSYVEWFSTLAPHYAAMGLELPFSASHFERLAGPRRGTGARRELGVLALCLMAHHREAGEAGASTAIARLDATLALFDRRPALADEILSKLAATSPGAGRETFPAFTTWLCGHLDPAEAGAVEAEVDRFVHLSRLAGRGLSLSRRLRSDFERDAALLRERAHLQGLAARSPEQETRLRRLASSSVAGTDPSRTRRRLRAEIEVLHGEAYEVQVDAVFRSILREAWDLRVDRLTPAWRDAIRFYLQTKRNHELLRVVLRAAAAGADIRRMTAQNQAWIAAARGRSLDVDAWLAPRHRSLNLGGKRFTLAVERDPVEVLRMGVPFDTCLSITGGFNAASTVINAADANKQVLYLRDRRKRIIARKLIAISEDDQLIGYNLYIADSARVREIEGAFADFCEELAKSVGVSLGHSGEPAQLHAGFWYDDGVEPFTRSPSAPTLVDAERYCAALGLPTPERMSPALLREASLFRALVAGDTPRVQGALRHIYDDNALTGRARAWLRERLTPEERADQRDNDLPWLSEAVLRAQVEPRPFLDFVAESERWLPLRLLSDLAPKPGFARILVEVARAHHEPDAGFDDHGFAHHTLSLLPRWIAVEPAAEALALFPLIEPIWRWIAASSEWCVDCVDRGRDEFESALRTTYATSPDPEAVLRAIEGRRASPTLRLIGLHIAATYSLGGDDPRASEPAPAIARRLARAGKREPWLRAEARFNAALIRQSAGELPHGVELASPEVSDFPGEALGPNLTDPRFRQHLGAWLEAPIEDGWSPAQWRPGPWELYLRRRLDPARPTPLRAELLRRALGRAPLASPASDWLARLGDHEAVASVRRAPLPPREPPRGKAKLTLSDAEQLAKSLGRQLRAVEADDLGSLDEDRQRWVYERLEGVDRGLAVAARALVDRHLDGERVDDDALTRAGSLLERSPGQNHYEGLDLLRRCVSRPEGELSPPVLRLARSLIRRYANLWSVWTPTHSPTMGAPPGRRNRGGGSSPTRT